MTQAHSFFINCLLFLLANVVVTLLLLVIGRNAKQMEEVTTKLLMLGILPGLVVNVEDSQSEPWSSDVGSNHNFN